MPTWSSTVKTWAAGDGTSAQFNSGVRDPINELRTYVSPSTWQNITMGASCVAGADGAVCRLEGERVFLEGDINRSAGTFTNGDTIGTLPVGYRPIRAQQFSTALVSGTTTRLNISTAGVITITVFTGTPSAMPIDGITFSTT